jgi:adenine-specific DNA-methyltransferase
LLKPDIIILPRHLGKAGARLKGTLDPEKFEALRGTVSLPFQAGKQKRVAVKLIDMRGNEAVRVLNLGQV